MYNMALKQISLVGYAELAKQDVGFHSFTFMTQ